MPGRNSNTGRGRGCGNTGRGRGKGKPQGNRGYTKPASTRGACADLGNHVFDYGPKGAADQMATTLEQINIYVGTKYGEEITCTNTMRNGKEDPIPKPTIPDSVMQAHQAKLAAMEARTRRLIAANEIAVQELEDQLTEAEAAATPTAQFTFNLLKCRTNLMN
jgi:hypothetical protein